MTTQTAQATAAAAGKPAQFALTTRVEAALPTERELRRLARLRSRVGVLSLYLNFDPAGGERRDAKAAFLDAVKSLDSLQLNDKERARLEEEQALVLEFARDRFALHGRSVILFSCRPRNLWQVFQLQVPVRPLARFAERPAVAQLAAVLDEHESYAVALIDKDEARLLSVYLGQPEQRARIVDKYPGRSRRGGWAEARYSHHRDVHLHAHALRVTEALLEELRHRPFDRLIIGGPDEARSALLHLLPRGLRGRVAGTFGAELFVSDEEIVERVHAIEEAAQREAEARLVPDLVEATSAGGPAVLGWEETLQALLQGRVHKLVLAEGRTQQGRVCPKGHAAVLEKLAACPFCGGRLEEVGDLAEWAVEKALDTDARVETVRAQAAEGLVEHGDGIAAVLRY